MFCSVQSALPIQPESAAEKLLLCNLFCNFPGINYFNRRIQSMLNGGIDLQIGLLDSWTKYGVADDYQDMFLVHLDQLSRPKQQQHIRNEIALTLRRQSPYFQLQNLTRRRQQILTQLIERLSTSANTLTQQQLEEVCTCLQKFREANLLIAELVLSMNTTFRCENKEAKGRQMRYYDPLLVSLDKDSGWLKKSILNRYMCFDQGYDPFFLCEYEYLHRGGSALPPIVRLFTFAISYAYRLMKTRNAVLELRAEMNSSASAKSVYPFFPEIEKVVGQKGQNKQSFPSPLSGRRLDESASVDLNNSRSLLQSRPYIIEPITVYSSHEEDYVQPRKYEHTLKREPMGEESRINQVLKFSRIVRNDRDSVDKFSVLSGQPKVHPKHLSDSIAKTNKVRQYDESEPRKQSLGAKQQRYKMEMGDKNKSFRLTPLRVPKPSLEQLRRQNVSNYLQDSMEQKEIREQRTPKQDNRQTVRILQYYNPIKGEEYSKGHEVQVSSKYDYNERWHASRTEENEQGDQRDLGIISEQPLTKNSLKQRHFNKKNDKTEGNIEPTKPVRRIQENSSAVRDIPLPSKRIKAAEPQARRDAPVPVSQIKQIEPQLKKVMKSEASSNTEAVLNRNTSPRRIDQECQTVLQQQPQRPAQKPSQPKLNKSQHKTVQPIKPKKKGDDDEITVLQGEIGDDPNEAQVQKPNQSLKQSTNNAKPPIESIKSPEKLKDSAQKEPNKGSPEKPNNGSVSAQNKMSQSQQKKQIKMKVGKSTPTELMQVLKKCKVNAVFEPEKLFQSIPNHQTYLTEFYINNQQAIVALCSPIPSVGIALKLWAPLTDTVDSKTSQSLFQKYIQYVQKSISSDKILFRGQEFAQLKAADFLLKKQKLHERSRKVASTKEKSQFMPFLYVECSNVCFGQKGSEKRLYSEEIEGFTAQNSYAPSFIGKVQQDYPQELKTMTKYHENLQGFTDVNRILTEQNFDNYEAGQAAAADINLLSISITTPPRSTFIAQDGWMRLTGVLVYEKGEECIVGVGTVKNNGFIYFGKKVTMAVMLAKIKAASKNSVAFTVKMFSKKLYGQMSEYPPGCYGNWEISFTWQDEMQGRLKYNIIEPRCFGAEGFVVAVEMEKQLLYCMRVGKEDFIF